MATRDTREALLRAGVELFLEGGYDFVGTNAILERARAPRGSFYHFFEDKQAFALAVAEHYYEQHLPMLDRFLRDERKPPLRRLRGYFEALAKEYAKQDFQGGCLLGMFGQELADRSAEARQALDRLFTRWRGHLASCLREARDRGDLPRTADCEELAGFLLDGWEGALMQMKLQRSGRPLASFVTISFETLLVP
ncbi:MAG: TetR family transcriptional regulator C-terminal domain-containing protein [Deltaproteobacteria bacterium]|nr:TetR family transcriptional regulator C-terminal domain-containing protein [Deltaproteobacteria bacterium]